MTYTPRAFTILDRLLPSPPESIDALVDEVIRRTGATTMRQAARALGATVRSKPIGGSLHAVCIPLSRGGEHGHRGARYAIVVDPASDLDEPDVWSFLVGHELGHIVTDSFGPQWSVGLGQPHPVEDWCDTFGRALAARLGDDRR